MVKIKHFPTYDPRETLHILKFKDKESLGSNFILEVFDPTGGWSLA